MRILTLDVGTSSMRGTVMDAAGTPLHTGQIQYHPRFCGADEVVQDPAIWVDALKRLCLQASAAGPVDAVAITAQRSSVIPLDNAGNPLSDAIMWQDSRNRGLCQALQPRQALVRARCGTDISPVFSGGKMLWFLQERPELRTRLRRFVVIPDYLIWHMTGVYVTDHTYGSRSMLMNLRERRWDPQLLELFSVEEAMLCPLIPPSSIAGRITPEFARITGLPQGIPVISCGGDQQCAALGQGIIRPGEVSVNLGTGAYLVAATDQVPKHLPQGVVCNASSIPGQYILESSILTCGAAVDWILELLREPEPFAAIDKALSESPRGANGVLMLPRLQGSVDQNAPGLRGIVAGLSLSVSSADLIRGLLEGICCEIRMRIEQMRQCVAVDQVHISGGLTRCARVCQLLSDILSLQVVQQDGGNATTRGAWMSACRCLDLVPDWDSAWKAVAQQPQYQFDPDGHAASFYGRLSKLQQRLLSAVEEFSPAEDGDGEIFTGPDGDHSGI